VLCVTEITIHQHCTTQIHCINNQCNTYNACNMVPAGYKQATVSHPSAPECKVTISS